MARTVAEVTFTVTANTEIAPRTWEMQLAGNTDAFQRPGQFANLTIPGFYLRRPISVCDWAPGKITIIYKTLGEGTTAMTEWAPGMAVPALTGLGNGFDISTAGETPTLIGGGVGIPPLYALAKALVAGGHEPQVVLGFNTSKEIFYAREFAALGCQVSVATMDGSQADLPVTFIAGTAVDALASLPTPSMLYSCGPTPMLKALHAHAKAAGIPGQFSLEERMGCGFGGCVGCTVRVHGEEGEATARVCVEGPVFSGEDLTW